MQVAQIKKKWFVPEERQELRPMHVAAIFNKNIFQQFGIK